MNCVSPCILSLASLYPTVAVSVVCVFPKSQHRHSRNTHIHTRVSLGLKNDGIEELKTHRCLLRSLLLCLCPLFVFIFHPCKSLLQSLFLSLCLRGKQSEFPCKVFRSDNSPDSTSPQANQLSPQQVSSHLRVSSESDTTQLM